MHETRCFAAGECWCTIHCSAMSEDVFPDSPMRLGPSIGLKPHSESHVSE